MADFVIAVRTYKRYDTFLKRTYNTLLENDLVDNLYIFVADEDEKAKYLAVLEGKKYKELIVGVKGGASQSNFIVNYFPEGKEIVFFDDDFYRFFNFDSTGKYYKRATNLKKYCEDGFATIKEMGTNIFTFSFIGNKMYLKGKPFKEFRPYFTAGCFYGGFNEKALLTIPVETSHMDDGIRSIQILQKYGGVLVYWWAGFETYYCKEPGGLQASGERDCDTKALCDKWWAETPNIETWMKPPYLTKEGVWQYRLLTLTSLKKTLASAGIELKRRSFPWADFILP